MNKLGAKIAEKRKSLGMTQIEFAEKMHVTRQTVIGSLFVLIPQKAARKSLSEQELFRESAWSMKSDPLRQILAGGDLNENSLFVLHKNADNERDHEKHCQNHRR